MKKSTALEQQVHRIHELLERSNDDVTWNDHIPDPDNPTQLRQIDVTVRKNGKLTIIECRLSRNRQDVKWIEELIGRRQSLGAHTVIAVASAGFTKGAQKKAASYGVLLRDLRQLSDEETGSWGGRMTLIIYYYQYSDVTLTLGFAPQGCRKINPSVLNEELQSCGIRRAAFNFAAIQLDKLKLLPRDDMRTINFGYSARPLMVYLCGEPILEMSLRCKVRLVAQPIISPGIFGYGEPGQDATQREARVERFKLGETSIVHHDDRIAIDIDLSSIALPPLSQIRYFRTTSTDELDYESFAISNPEKLEVTGPIDVELYSIQAGDQRPGPQ